MAAGDLTDLSSVKALLGFTTTGSDARLQSLITAISAMVPNAIQRQILTGQYVEIRRGNGRDRFQLRQWPVQSITLVEWPGVSISAQGDIFAVTPGIATDGRSLILVGYSMPYGQSIRITYTAGFDTVPADISDAVCELVAEEYKRASHIGETSHSSNGATTVSFSQKAMHDAIAAKLQNYLAVAPLC